MDAFLIGANDFVTRLSTICTLAGTSVQTPLCHFFFKDFALERILPDEDLCYKSCGFFFGASKSNAHIQSNEDQGKEKPWLWTVSH